MGLYDAIFPKSPEKFSQIGFQNFSENVQDQLGKVLAPPAFGLSAESQQESQSATPAPKKWQEFAPKFNERFKSILHVFAPEGTEEKLVGIDAASGDALSALQLQYLFTEDQREKLNTFCETNTIPDRLFNCDDWGRTTASQRILMSAEILESGVYSPDMYEQRVYAKCCGHWVQVVNNYAGVTRNNGPNSDSLNGNFDLFGNVIMGAQMDNPEGEFKGKKWKYEELPTEESNTIGPIYSTTNHGKEAEKRLEKLEKRNADKAAGIVSDKEEKSITMPFRREHLQTTEYGNVQPGDWLYYYAANGSGEHSVIFSRWASGWHEKHGIKFRKAIVFDQQGAGHYGREDEVNLGQQFYSGSDISIRPITYIHKTNENAHPAQTVEELLPKSGKKEEQIKAGNEAFIDSVEKESDGAVNRSTIMQLLKEENIQHIENLKPRLTAKQYDLLNDANKTNDLETLVRLTQRLRQLDQNASVLQENHQKQFSEGYREEYEKKIQEYEQVSVPLEKKLSELYDDRTKLEVQLDQMEEDLAEFDLGPELKAARKELAALREERSKFKKGTDEYKKADEKYQSKKADVEDYKAEKANRADEVSSRKDGVNKQKRLVAGNKSKITKAEKELEEAKSELPWKAVAGGSISDQDDSDRKAVSNGDLQDLFTKKMLLGKKPSKGS